LAGGIAHDFNNLHTVITTYCDLLLEDLGREDPKREDVEQVRKAAEGATALTRQLLAFSRQQVLEPKVVSMSAVVSGVEKMLRRAIGEDAEPGRGTTFKIYLPRVDAPAEAGAAATPGDLPRGTETVLIVEDAAPVRAVMRHVLERQGYAVLEASNGAAALELVAGHP